MTVALVSFNLLVNAAISLLAALGLALGACRLFGIEHGRARALLLSAPLFKAGYEIARGIPEGAFFWAKLHGARQELGSFKLGFGLEFPVIPVIDLSLGALFQGHDYPQSAADLLAGVLSKGVAPALPLVLGALLLSLALLGFARFVFEARRGVLAQRALLATAPRETRPCGRRMVRIFVSDDWQGVPCAGGVFRPWVCMSAQLERALSADERNAVIAHELAHLAHHDLLLLSATRLIAQVLFFVPGARWLVHRVQVECELAADRRATRSVSALTLASALVRVAELCQQRAQAPAQLSFLRPGRALHERVETLIASAGSVPVSPQRKVVLHYALTALAIAMVLRAALFHNH